MATEAFNLTGTVDVNPSAALQGLTAVEKGAEKTASTLERIGTSFGKTLSKSISIGLGDVGKAVDSLINITESGLRGIPVVGSAIAATFHEVSGVLQDATARGFAYNDVLKEQRIQLELVTGNAAEAKRELSEIGQIAFKTGVGRGFLVDAVQDLQLFNVDAQRAIDLVRALSNQATATGGGEGRVMALTDLIERVLETGKLDSRSVRQLIRQKIPVFDIIADELKVSKQKAQQLINSGALSGDDLITIFTAQFNRPKWTRAAEEMTQTMDGLQRKYTSSVNKLLGVATEPAYKTGVKALNEAVGAVRGPQAGQIAAQTQAAIAPVTALLEQVGSALKSGDIFGGALAAGQSITAGLSKGVTETAGAAVGAVKDLGLKGIGALKDVWDSHSPSGVAAAIGSDIVEGLAYGKGGKGGLASEESKEKLRKAVEELAKDPRIQAWFEIIRQVEGGQPDVMAGGRHVKSGPRHPGEIIPRSEWFQGPKGRSSAAGNWQETLTNWRKWAPLLGLNNFSDTGQQLMAALPLFMERGGHTALLSGNYQGALAASSPWAATPLSHLPGRKPLNSQQFIDRYQSLIGGGSLAGVNLSGPVPVSIVSAPGLTGGITTADTDLPVLSGLQPVTESFESVVGKTQIFKQALEPLPIEFEKMGDAAEDAGSRSEEALKRLRERVGGFRQELRDLGFTTENMKGIFTSAFEDAFAHTEDGWRSMLLTFVSDFSQAIEQMVVKALAARLAEKLFGGESGPGWLSWLFKIGSSAASSAVGGGGFGGAGAGGSFARGGSFIVGGPAGIDRTPVSFMASRGERVTVETPGQQRAGGNRIGEVHVHVHGVQNPNQFLARETQNQIARKTKRMLEAA